MACQLDMQGIEDIVVINLEAWTGTPLNTVQRRVLDRFMETQVKPMDCLALTNRMGTPADVLEWVLTYMREQIPERWCEAIPGMGDAFVCHAV